MKKVKYPNLNDYDLSAYEELKGDVLYKINGGEYIANTNDAVANGHVGDILVRDDGTEIVINQGDITYAREHGGRVNDTGSSGGNSNSGGSGSNTNNNSNNTGSTSTGNGSNTTTTTTGGGASTNSGSNSAGRTNANAGSNSAGTGSQAAVNPSRPSGVPGGVKGNTVTGKPIAGCVIEHTDDNQSIIKVSWNDKMALKEAEDKFLAYTNGGFDCRLEVYTANGSARVFNRFADFYDEVHPNKPSTILYENEFLKIEAGKVSGGYNFKDSTPWEIEASALEFNSSLNCEKIDIKSSTQLLNLEGNISYGSIDNPGFSMSAKASALDLEWEASFHLGGYSINISPEAYLGSVGMEATFAPNKVKFGLALGVGAGVGVNWNREQ